jgi:hypothetical protein
MPTQSSATSVDWQLLTCLIRARSHPKGRLRIAKACGTSPKHLGDLERGDVAEPRFDTGIRLLDYAESCLNQEDWNRIRAASPLAR